MIIDFRVRPPVTSFRSLSICPQLDWQAIRSCPPYTAGVQEKVLYKNAAKLLGLSA